jgi:prevent-host-death family protein
MHGDRKEGTYSVQDVQNRRYSLWPTELPRFPITSARRRFAGLVNRVAYRGERVLLSRHGKPVAGLVPLSDMSRLFDLDLPRRSAGSIGDTTSIGEALARSLEEELGLSAEPPRERDAARPSRYTTGPGRPGEPP